MSSERDYGIPAAGSPLYAATISVADLGRSLAIYRDTLGLDEVGRRSLGGPAFAVHWRLPADASAQLVVLADRNAPAGRVALLQFDAPQRHRIRDTDGQIFNDKQMIKADPYNASYVYATWDRYIDFTLPHDGSAAVAAPTKVSGREALIAWFPWILLSVLVFIWGLPQAKAFMNSLQVTNFVWSIPGLDKAVLRAAPVVLAPEPEPASWSLNWLSATGTALLLTGIISGFVLGLRASEIGKSYLHTLNRVKYSIVTIAAMLALGYTTRYAGLDATMGLALASTGFLFPFFSPFLGWLGVALTGSDTSSNVLFGNLQQITAKVVGVSPILAAASNSSGGVMGKMIDAQSIVVAGVATKQQGNEGDILRYVFFHSLALIALVGILVFLQAYVFTWMIPGG